MKPFCHVKPLTTKLSLLMFLLLAAFMNDEVIQAQTPQEALDNLVTMIQSNEAQFRLPTTDLTETIGTLDLSKGVNPRSLGKLFTYGPGIPTYQDGSFDTIGIPIIRAEDAPRPRPGQSTAIIIPVPKVGADLTEVNVRNLTLRIAIIPPSGWTPPSGAHIKVHLGSTDQPDQILPITATEAVFPNVTGDNVPFWIELDGFLTTINPTNGFPSPGFTDVKGLATIKLSRPILGAGALVLPVVPVSIIYAPIVDAQKKNTAGFTNAHTSGNTSTVSFSKQNSQTSPINSTFQSTVDTEKDMAETGAALQKVPNPYVQAVGVALSTIASGMGSSTATQTIATSVTSQNSLSVTEATSNKLTALASGGGPGVSDIIAYYPNVRVVWYSKGGPMRLAVLGSGIIVYTTAQTLKDALACLQQTPVCVDFAAKYKSLNLDAAAISSLLKLDPFVAGGPAVSLDPHRFLLRDSIEFSGLDGSKTYSNSVKLASTETSGNATVTTDVQKDSPGFLSFLGIGITQDDTLQSQISQSTSLQTSSDQSMIEDYVMNGDGHEYYATEVYLDTAYGAFAFRNVSAVSPQPVLTGTLTDASGNAVGNAPITVIAAERKFSSVSDKNGKFTFHLPGVTSGQVKLKSGEAEAQADLGLTPTKVVLKRK